jgi:hypothetical protein
MLCSHPCIPACASSVVELWFAVADFPKGALGADVVTKAALLALLLDLQFAVWEKRHRKQEDRISHHGSTNLFFPLNEELGSNNLGVYDR